MKSILKIAGIITILSGLATGASADVIAERKGYFKQNGQALRAMRSQIANNDFAAIAMGAETIASWAGQMTSYFPEDSDLGDTDARPEIWDRFSEFTMLAKNNKEAALALVAAAQTGDSAQVTQSMQALGKTCGACHSQFKY